MTLLFVGTAIAQNPTILQGSYISNVFGNSNFVLNPNAQTNVANVTTVTATVARSTTTPLVATSEFTVAIGTANGTATWATRAFDAGMKGQNCEARFSYRGFAATSIVQIKQSTNVVASLTLTPATDPRIASINFPCGDLSTATTFVVTDTAILAGTNEIGGIYVGLATNLGQLNTVGVWQSYTPTVTPGAGTLTSTTLNYAQYRRVGESVEIRVSYVATQTTSNAFGWTFSIPSEITLVTDSVSLAFTDRRTTSVVVNSSNPVVGSIRVVSPTTLEVTPALNGGTYIAGQQFGIAFYVTQKVQGWGADPVVTPERQNTWGGVVYDDSAQNVFYGTMAPTAFTSYNDATWNKPTKLKGKASVTTTNTGNDLGFSVDQLPVGNYKVTLTNGFYTDPGLANGNAAICIFRVRETTTNTIIGRIQLSGTRLALFNVTQDGFGVIDGVFTQTSLGQRNFILEASKQADTSGSQDGQCVTQTNTNILSFTITPLDQPSNSALYVQGPVLGAQTGAAIPAGYVGEKKTVHIGSETNVPSSGAWYNIGNMTLTTGVWSCTLNGLYEQNGANFTSVGNALFAFSDAVAPSGPAYTYRSQGATAGGIWPTSFVYGTLSIPPMVLLSNGSQITWPDGVTRGTTTLHVSGFLSTYTAGTPRYLMRAECTRLN